MLLPVQHSVFPLPAILSSSNFANSNVQADATTDASSFISFSQMFHAFSSSLTNAFRSFAPMTSRAIRSKQPNLMPVPTQVSARPSNAQLSLRYPQQLGFSTLPGGIFDIPKSGIKSGVISLQFLPFSTLAVGRRVLWHISAHHLQTC